MLNSARLVAFVLSALLAACGGGGSSSGPPESVARVEIRQTAALLTQPGASAQLAAVAYDAQDQVVDTPIGWRSNTPAEISVDAAGKITAQVANGSSQIVAEAGGVSSAPLLAVVTALPEGAVVLTDAQIVGDPHAADPDAAPSFANTYEVVLGGVAAPAVGALLVNTESKPVGGRVVAVRTSGAQSTVTLQLVSLREMFPNLAIRQTLDLARAPVQFPAELAAKYDIARSGDTYTFTPRPGAFGAAGSRQRALAATGTSALPPFTSCESSFSALPIALSAPPLFSVTISPSLDLLYTAANGLERFVVQAEPVFKVEGGLSVTAAFEGKIDCKLELFVFRVPVGGPLSLFIGGLVPVGAGIEAGGKFTIASMGIGSKVEAKAKARIGLACPGGSNCEFVRALTDSNLTYTPTMDLPSIGDLRVEPTLMAYGYFKAEIGNPFLRRIRFEAFTARAGGKLAGSFAHKLSQITDTAYKSDYKVSLEAGAGVGADLQGALNLLGLSSVSALELTISTDLAQSPVGSMSVDRAMFNAGDSVNFSVHFDPAHKDFFAGLGPYNIRRVLLVRMNGLQTTVVAAAEAAAGQTEFTLPFTASDFGSAGEFTAFVVTGLLPLDVLALEVGRATAYAMDLQLPSTIPAQAPATANVTVTRTDERGAATPAGNLFVALRSDCGSLSPATGRTDAQGRLVASLTPAGCATSVAVTAVASENEGSAPLAQATTSAAVGAATSIYTLSIDVGSHTPGMVEVWFLGNGDDRLVASGPVGDIAAVMSQVRPLLAGINEITNLVGVIVAEPVSLALNLPVPVGGVQLAGLTDAACGSDISVTVGAVRNQFPGRGLASVGGCLGRATLSTGDIDQQLTVGGSNTVVNVSVGKIGNALIVGHYFGSPANGLTVNIRASAYNALGIYGIGDSTINIQGALAAQPPNTTASLTISGATGIRLGPISSGGLTNVVSIESSSFVSPPSLTLGPIVRAAGDATGSTGNVRIATSSGLSLGAIGLGDIDGDLRIQDNRGFSDADANGFAQAHLVKGTTTISGNHP